jgi:hypothetical protein
MFGTQHPDMRASLLLVVLFAWTTTLSSGCSLASCSCDPDRIARNLAGTDATDCADSGDLESERTCVATELAAGRPFVLRQILQGIDSEVLRYVIGDAEGRTFVGDYDSDPSGGSGACEVFDVSECGATEIDPMPTEGNEAFFFLCLNPGPRRSMCD